MPVDPWLALTATAVPSPSWPPRQAFLPTEPFPGSPAQAPRRKAAEGAEASLRCRSRSFRDYSKVDSKGRSALPPSRLRNLLSRPRCEIPRRRFRPACKHNTSELTHSICARHRSCRHTGPLDSLSTAGQVVGRADPPGARPRPYWTAAGSRRLLTGPGTFFGWMPIVRRERGHSLGDEHSD